MLFRDPPCSDMVYCAEIVHCPPSTSCCIMPHDLIGWSIHYFESGFTTQSSMGASTISQPYLTDIPASNEQPALTNDNMCTPTNTYCDRDNRSSSTCETSGKTIKYFHDLCALLIRCKYTRSYLSQNEDRPNLTDASQSHNTSPKGE